MRQVDAQLLSSAFAAGFRAHTNALGITLRNARPAADTAPDEAVATGENTDEDT